MIKAPYNFVPLSEKVVMPFWAEHITQDIPFKDAKSGTLKLKIRAESPIYVRNGMPRDADKEDPSRNDFNNINGNCFIPGSSIKGMLRSVVEMMSFGRMKNKVNPDKYSVRDFQNRDIYPKETFAKDINCGFLKIVNGAYLLKDCGKPGRISQRTLSESFHKHFSSQNKFDKQKNPKGWKNNGDYNKSAKYKYDSFSDLLSINNFDFDKEDNGRSIFKIGSEKKGRIIFTGQPGYNDCKEIINKKTGETKIVCGKHYEFIFFDSKNEFKPISNNEDEAWDIIKNFLFAYYDHDKNNQKPDWEKQWGPKLKDGEEIPVFFRKVNNKIIDIGLSYLYKITYNHSILDAINNQQKNADSYDLAEAIFGYVDDKKALKGRVHIGHAFVSNGKPTPLGEKMEVLAGPKASYYPNYIEQSPNDSGTVRKYKTFMDRDATIRGWKRYPIHSGDVKRNPPPEIRGRVNEKVASKFVPLPKSTEFELDITYHNLREEELGALISAITFHNTDGLYHSIGSAKPLGYGKIKVSIEDGLSKEEQMNAMKAYEAYMDYALEHSTPSWYKSEQIKELFAMAKPGSKDEKLTYMKLTEFVNVKGRKRNDPQYALRKYSQINESEVYAKPLISAQELKNAQKAYEEEKVSFENLKDIKELKEQKSKEAKDSLKQRIDELKERLTAEIVKLKIEALQREKEEKKAKEEQERLEIRAERQDDAKEQGFKLPEDFDFLDRNAFNTLSNLILDYAEDLHQKNENQLKKDLVDKAWVQENDFEIIKNSIEQVYKNLPNKKEIKKWNKKPLDKNFAYRKVKDWLGERYAIDVFKNLLNP